MERVTVRLILRRCRMARATFYGIFPTKTEALEYACQAATDFLVGAVREARQDGEGTSRGTVVDGFLQAVDEEPLLAELCLVHSKSAPVPEADRFFSALIQELCEGLEGTRFDDELVALAIAQTVALQLRRKSNPNLREVRTALASWNLW
jgi:AcrR family transcriptional regulator